MSGQIIKVKTTVGDAVVEAEGHVDDVIKYMNGMGRESQSIQHTVRCQMKIASMSQVEEGDKVVATRNCAGGFMDIRRGLVGTVTDKQAAGLMVQFPEIRERSYAFTRSEITDEGDLEKVVGG